MGVNVNIWVRTPEPLAIELVHDVNEDMRCLQFDVDFPETDYPLLWGPAFHLIDEGLGPPPNTYEVECTQRVFRGDYQRGNWPVIKEILTYLRRKLPNAVVSYDGDDEWEPRFVVDDKLLATIDFLWSVSDRNPDNILKPSDVPSVERVEEAS